MMLLKKSDLSSSLSSTSEYIHCYLAANDCYLTIKLPKIKILGDSSIILHYSIITVLHYTLQPV